jgi:hypothetical protein
MGFSYLFEHAWRHPSTRVAVDAGVVDVEVSGYVFRAPLAGGRRVSRELLRPPLSQRFAKHRHVVVAFLVVGWRAPPPGVRPRA